MKKPFYYYCVRGICVLLICLLASVNFCANAQQPPTESRQQTVAVSGIVVDETGEPLIGASVIEDGSSNGTTTNIDGKFEFFVNPKAKLKISFIGYRQQLLDVANQTVFDIKLLPDYQKLDEVVVVGYGVQSKASLTGAISQIKSADIVSTKNENIQNMLSGKLAGVRVVQNNAEPGSFDVSFDVRGLGSPLVVIDGVPRGTMTRIDPNDVESISVLKDASAAIYGVRAGGGVVLITTKKGGAGKMEIDYTGNVGWQTMSGFPDMVNAVEYMTLTNEIRKHSRNTQLTPYTDAQFEPYLNGTLQSTDWKAAVMRNVAPQTQHNISATGGTERVNYYMSVGYMSQQSFLKTNDINYDRYNIRGNISAKITNNLRVEMNLAGISDEKKQPTQGSGSIIRSLWHRSPLDPIYANNNPEYLYETAVTGDNPVAQMSSELTGYGKFTNKWFQSSVSAIYDVPFLKGLQLKGMYSYDYNVSDNTTFRKEYSQYRYDESTETYNAFAKQSPQQLRREYYAKDNALWNISINYNNRFGDHTVGALLLFENSWSKGDNFYAQRELPLPIDRLSAGAAENQVGYMYVNDGALYDLATQALVGRFTYDYLSRYLLEFSFRYDGSAKFPPAHRWAMFPSIQGAWRVSEESFWKNSPLAFIDNLKFRVSYGELGDDSSLMFQFYQGYVYPTSGGVSYEKPAGSVFNEQFVNSSSSTGVPNYEISWMKSKMLNIGLDFDAWNGLLGATIEIFKRDRSGLLATRDLSLPDIVGSALPQENLNSDQNKGFELELSHANRINDFSYEVRGNFSYTRHQYKDIEEGEARSSYLRWRQKNTDRMASVYWGYGDVGRFQSWDDIINSPVYASRETLPGDYIYEDWNGDGMISDLDVHPISTTNTTPLINYGITIKAAWKGIDLNMLLQGVALRTISYTELLREPLWAGTGALSQFMDRWHPEDPTADPYDPNVRWVEGYYAYTGSLPHENSPFNMQNASYLRLKSLELGYTIPQKFIKRLGIKNLRIYVSGYNLLTFTTLKYMDPEHPSSNWGYIYPHNKTYNVGVNVKF